MKKYYLSGLLTLIFSTIYTSPTQAIMTEDLCSQMLIQQHKDEKLTKTQITKYCDCIIPKTNQLLDQAIATSIPQKVLNQKVYENTLTCLNKAGIKATINTK